MKYVAEGVPASAAEARVLALWSRLPSPPKPEMFRWCYREGCTGEGQCFLLQTATTPAEVVGMAGLGQRRIETASGPLRAALLGGFFVDKAHRTLFPALTLQRAVLAWTRQGFDLVYGFPNESAAPVLKRLGFKDLVKLSRHVLVLRHARYLTPILRSGLAARAAAVPADLFRRVVQPGASLPAPRGLAFAEATTLDARFDRLFTARAFPGHTTGARDAALLTWRFLRRPDEHATVYALSAARSGELHGYAIVHFDGVTAHVRDLLGIDLDAMMTTLRLTAGAVRRAGASAISFLFAGPSEMSTRLRALGFRERPTTRVLIGHAGDSLAADPAKADVLPLLERWYVTEADEDQ